MAQDSADKRFGGFLYGDDFVIRDFVAERKPGVAGVVFKAPDNMVDSEDVMRRVRRNYVQMEVEKMLRDWIPQLALKVE